MNFKKIILSSVALTTLICSETLFASGLSIPLESVAALGEQRSGGAAVADDASTNFFNAAGLIRVKHQQIIFSATGAAGQQKFSGTISNPGIVIPGLDSGAFTQTGSVSTSVFAVVPSIHYVFPINPRLAFGFSILSPYSLSSNYPEDSLVRYEIITGHQKSIDLSPSLAYAVTEKFSIGAGLDLLYLAAYQKAAVRTQPLTVQDSILTTDYARHYTPGWHAGILYQFTPHTRVGLSHRSSFVVHLSGRAQLNVPDGPFMGVSTYTSSRSILPLGSLTTLSIYHDMSAKWALMGSIEHEGWGTYAYDHSYSVPVIGGGLADSIARRGLRDTWFYSVGTRYHLSDCLLVRGGISYWQGASNGQTGDLSIVDPNSVGISIGSRYQYTPTIAFDFAIGHIFTQQLNLNYTAPSSGDTTVGHSTEGANMLGAQVTWNIS